MRTEPRPCGPSHGHADQAPPVPTEPRPRGLSLSKSASSPFDKLRAAGPGSGPKLRAQNPSSGRTVQAQGPIVGDKLRARHQRQVYQSRSATERAQRPLHRGTAFFNLLLIRR